jgi:hypothetical protein
MQRDLSTAEAATNNLVLSQPDRIYVHCPLRVLEWNSKRRCADSADLKGGSEFFIRFKLNTPYST